MDLTKMVSEYILIYISAESKKDIHWISTEMKA